MQFYKNKDGTYTFSIHRAIKNISLNCSIDGFKTEQDAKAFGSWEKKYFDFIRKSINFLRVNKKTSKNDTPDILVSDCSRQMLISEVPPNEFKMQLIFKIATVVHSLIINPSLSHSDALILKHVLEICGESISILKSRDSSGSNNEIPTLPEEDSFIADMENAVNEMKKREEDAEKAIEFMHKTGMLSFVNDKPVSLQELFEGLEKDTKDVNTEEPPVQETKRTRIDR